MGLFASPASLYGTDLPQKGFGKTALLNDTQNFVFFDTLVYPVGCWHQDKFEASEENEAYCLWLDIPCVPLEKPLQVQDHGGRLEFLFRCIYEEYQKPNACLLYTSPSPRD